MIENLVSSLNSFLQYMNFTLPKEHISVVIVVVVCDEYDGPTGGPRVSPEPFPSAHRHIHHHTTNTQLSEGGMRE